MVCPKSHFLIDELRSPPSICSPFLLPKSQFQPQNTKRRNPSRTSKKSDPPQKSSGLTGRSFLSLGFGWLLLPPGLDPNHGPPISLMIHPRPLSPSPQLDSPVGLTAAITNAVAHRRPFLLGQGMGREQPCGASCLQTHYPIDKEPRGSCGSCAPGSFAGAVRDSPPFGE